MSRKWVYGKQEWKTYERGQENCYLMTNGLGGFSSMTMTGSVTRNDHAFFMACTKAPNNRFNMVHRLAEKLETGGREHVLSSQKFADGKVEDGYRYLILRLGDQVWDVGVRTERPLEELLAEYAAVLAEFQ